MIAALVTSIALAAIPSGFHEATTLDPIASFVAGKPAHIYCADSDTDWNTYARSVGVPGANAATYQGTDETMLFPLACRSLLAKQEGGRVSEFYFAASLLVLVHESIHQRGEADEGKTECAALRLLPQVAHRFFGYRYHRKPLRNLMAQAIRSHRMKPAAYTAVC